MYWCVCASYNSVYNVIFVYVILYLDILFYIYPVHGLFHHWIIATYVFVLIVRVRVSNTFVNNISMVTAIGLCTSYDLLLGFDTSWPSCHAYFLYIIGYYIVVILVDLWSQKWINISLLNYLSHSLKHISLFLLSQYLIYLFPL